MSAIGVGQEVQIRSGVKNCRYDGRIGTVEFMDSHTSLNVRVRFSVGGSNWFSEGELIPIAPRGGALEEHAQ